MLRRWQTLALIALLAWIATLTALPHPTDAQQTFTPDDVIALVAQSAQFSEGLAGSPEWRAAAFPTGNAYSIWRVTFWDSEGEEIGTADINPEQARIYSYNSYFMPTVDLRQAAEAFLRDYVAALPEVTELLPDAADYEMYIDYDRWGKFWYIYIDVAEDSLYVLVQFDGGSATTLDNPRLLQVGFPNVMSYDDWHAANSASATSIAFTQPEIAAYLRDRAGWTSAAGVAEDSDGAVWWVGFYLDDTLLAEATVNVLRGEVQWWEVHSQ
ncbi:MAG: hypothetical protein SF123_25275 [Chloroflexota bacterium]|nr:hypothetical protein [Chloroflexota bacterium]